MYWKSKLQKFFLEAEKIFSSHFFERFGKGPHRIEFQLEFPPEEIPDGTADKFVIEMAPLDLVSFFHPCSKIQPTNMY